MTYGHDNCHCGQDRSTHDDSLHDRTLRRGNGIHPHAQAEHEAFLRKTFNDELERQRRLDGINRHPPKGPLWVSVLICAIVALLALGILVALGWGAGWLYVLFRDAAGS